MMKKTVAISSSEFEAQARRMVSLTFALTESRIHANKCCITPELRALSAAALSLEKAIAAFIAVERLCK